MDSPQRAFVSGKYRGDIVANIAAARLVAEELWRRGYDVFCPHMNSAYMDGVASDEHFLESGLRFLEVCHLIVMVAGWQESEGARKELKRARELGLNIWYVPDWPPIQRRN